MTENYKSTSSRNYKALAATGGLGIAIIAGYNYLS